MEGLDFFDSSIYDTARFEEWNMTALATDYLVRVFGTPYGPYIRLPYERLPELTRILEDNHIVYKAEESKLSFDGGPYLIYVHLQPSQTAESVRTLVDHMNAKE